ncbi:MAG: pantoate--beta-alanine ligase [Bacteriovoracaceae bacterium]|nr:pantoate--beta-alanine ligase [Bacteriovoracaceae bacterium]
MAVYFFDTLTEYSDWVKNKKKKTVGLVPTMGNLHNAHLSLLKKSIKENDISVITIFVNPKQFGPKDDFQKYPRTLESDIAKISDLAAKMKLTKNKHVVIFSPEESVIYPKNFMTTISISPLNSIIEGKSRPGHFDGVCTVVYRLFTLFKPNIAYFGEKDYQQLTIIKKMVEDLALPIKISPIPIGREKSGLAMSSRNQYLNSDEKIQALKLRNSLVELKDYLLKNHYEKTVQHSQKLVKADPRFNYLEIRDAVTLMPPEKNCKNFVILGVYQINQTRLLDNITVRIK